MPTIKKRVSSTKKSSEPEIMNAVHMSATYLSKYRQQMIIAAASIAVLLVIIAAYTMVQSGNDKKASALLAAAYQVYSPASGMQPDFKKACDMYLDISKKFSGTTSAAVAQYYAANCLVNLGQMNDALREYQIFANKYSGNKELAGLVYQRMGYVYNALGNREEAITSFEKSENVLGPGAGTIELARLYEQSGKVQDSRNKYKTITDKLAGTSWDMEAKAKAQKDVAAMPSPVKETK